MNYYSISVYNHRIEEIIIFLVSVLLRHCKQLHIYHCA